MSNLKFLLVILLFIPVILFSQKNDDVYNVQMVLVDGGEFIMGQEAEQGLDAKFEHKVVLNSFLIGKYEVTTEEFRKFAKFSGIFVEPELQGNLAITNVSWFTAIMYCNWLSGAKGYDKCYNIEHTKEGKIVTFNREANGFRLPTEAEWEYAARGGLDSRGYVYSGSHNANEVAIYVNTKYRLYKVGSKLPNELGIYDMSGNSAEWCWDYYDKDYYKNSSKDNPTGPKTGSTRVVRGGNFYCSADMLSVGTRMHYPPETQKESIGFRVARNPTGQATKMDRK